MNNYSQKLKDPRWQKKRLEIMQRDDFRCQNCQDKTATLHVHHRFYLKNHEPWQYNDNALVTLCESCHALEEATKSEAQKEIYESLCSFGYLNNDILHIADLFKTPADGWPKKQGLKQALEVLLFNNDIFNQVLKLIQEKPPVDSFK